MMGSSNLNAKLDQIAFMKYSDFLKTVFNAYIMISWEFLGPKHMLIYFKENWGCKKLIQKLIQVKIINFLRWFTNLRQAERP